MAYIGRDIQYGVLDKQSFTTNSSTTVFTLDSGVKDAKSLLVSVGGVIQEPDVAYTASGTTLTFSTAPATGMVAYAIYLGKTLESGGVRDQITFQNETGDGTTTPFTLSATPANAQSIMVTLNGVTQVPNTDYTVSGTVITFTVAPVNGMGILVYHLGSAAAIGTINDASVTDAKIVGMSASKISGSLGANTVANTSIVSLDASKLTGTLPNSLAVDTTALDQTIAALGLHVAVADNKVSFNLPDAFLDQFEGDDGILTETTVDRDTSGEYVNTASDIFVGTTAYVTGDRTSYITVSTTHTPLAGIPSALVDGVQNAGHPGSLIFTAGEATAGEAITFDFTTSKKITEATWYQANSSISYGTWKWQASADATSWTDIGSSFAIGNALTQVLTELSGNTLGYRYYRLFGVSGTVGNGWIDEIEFKELGATTSIGATGTLISTASTASSATTSASGVMLYSDASGTATLGTDLEVYFSADDGANWTEASSYGTPITFSGTTKMVKLGKTTGLTSGTQMKLKAQWANQVASVAGGYDTGDRTSSITVTTNQATTGSITNLVDGVEANNTSDGCYFTPNGFSVSGKYIRFQFSSTKVITETKLYNQNNGAEHLGTWKWQGSNDATTWTDISDDYILSNNTSPEITSMSLSGTVNTTSYTYYQLLGVSGTGHSEWIQEMYFQEAGVTGKETRLHGWALNY